MQKKRILVATLVALVVIVVAAVLIIGSRLDRLVGAAIETHGSRLTGTAVTVADVSVKLREGRVELGGLTVANPAGFSGQPALTLGRLVLDLEPGSLTGEPYFVDELQVADVTVRYEVDANGRRNLDVIGQSLRAAQPAPSAPAPAAPAPLLIVDRLEMAGGTVTTDASALGVESRTADLPGFTLTGLGAPNGTPADVIGRQVLRRVTEQAARAAVDQELKGRLEKALGGRDPAQAVKDEVGKLLGGG
ncbi:MAG: hypothetical protein ABR506_11495 [Candidatus Krumholzibacteriia bacterium]